VTARAQSSASAISSVPHLHPRAGGGFARPARRARGAGSAARGGTRAEPGDSDHRRARSWQDGAVESAIRSASGSGSCGRSVPSQRRSSRSLHSSGCGADVGAVGTAPSPSTGRSAWRLGRLAALRAETHGLVLVPAAELALAKPPVRRLLRTRAKAGADVIVVAAWLRAAPWRASRRPGAPAATARRTALRPRRGSRPRPSRRGRW
jgi:hypothetical protein